MQILLLASLVKSDAPRLFFQSIHARGEVVDAEEALKTALKQTIITLHSYGLLSHEHVIRLFRVYPLRAA